MNPANVRHFWDWFRARADKVRVDPERHAEEIGEMLGRLHPELGWEMGSPDGKTWDFIIRCEGGDLRVVAHEVVATAPRVPGWRFLEWRPAHGSGDWEIRVENGRTFHLAKMTAALEPDPKYPVVNVVLSSPEFSRKVKDFEQHAGYLMLDAVLGERVVEDSLEGIEFRAAPAGPIAASRLAKEVERLLGELRSRPCKATEEWGILKGEMEGKLVFAKVALAPDVRKMPGHPWRIDVSVEVREPDGDGLPGKGELKLLQDLDDRLNEGVTAKISSVPWTSRTCDGIRTTSLYVAEPIGIPESVRPIAAAAGYEASIVIDYDPRWQEYRKFVT